MCLFRKRKEKVDIEKLFRFSEIPLNELKKQYVDLSKVEQKELQTMNALTINECCAICEKHRKADCRLFKLFKSAKAYGDYDDDDIHEDSLVMVCKEFKPNKSLETYTPWIVEPSNPFGVPNPDYGGHHCKTWKDCTNPQYDCINCPLRIGGGGWTTTGKDFIISTFGTNTGQRDFEEKETTTDKKE